MKTKKKQQKPRDPIQVFDAAVKKIKRSKNPPDTIALHKPRDYRDDYDKAIRAFNIVRKERDAAKAETKAAYQQGYHDGSKDILAKRQRWAWAFQSNSGWIDDISDTRREVIRKAERVLNMPWGKCKRRYNCKAIRVDIYTR